MWRTLILPSAMLLGALCVPASADPWNKKTNLKVHETINVSGTVLPPGDYVMKLADSQSNRHIVQIFNGQENELKATILAIPNYRLKPTGDTEFLWWESASGDAKPLRAWFYPGDNFGQEFVYPKDMAKQIAATTDDPVPTTDAMKSEDYAKANVRAMQRSGEEQDLRTEDYTPTPMAAATQSATQPPLTERQQEQQAQREQQPRTQTASPDPGLLAQQQQQERQPAPTTFNNDTDTNNEELPATASPFAAIGLAGVAATFLGWFVRRNQARRQL